MIFTEYLHSSQQLKVLFVNCIKTEGARVVIFTEYLHSSQQLTVSRCFTFNKNFSFVITQHLTNKSTIFASF